MKQLDPLSQLELFESSNATQGIVVGQNNSGFDDPAFASNKVSPVHRWVPWIAGFSRKFVQSGLERYLKRKGTVLDPFAGVGTTLIEANFAGHDAVGFEINPYAAFASHIKLQAHRTDSDLIEKSVGKFLHFHRTSIKKATDTKSVPPKWFRTRGEFYSPKVLHKVLLTQDFIGNIEDRAIRDLFRLAFASTMITYSNYSYEPSLGQRVSVGRSKIEDFSVEEEIARKLNEMAHDTLWMKKRLNGNNPKSHVINSSFFDAYRSVKSSSIDLLITSPPYLNNYHYNRNTRPHLYWLGFVHSTKDLRILEHQNFGKFWQTVREMETIELDPIIKDEEIIGSLNTLRKKNPEKGIYGGKGWANYATSYFNDCVRFTRGAKWSLRKHGTALVVIGNSILQGVPIPTDRFLGSIAESAGLEVIDIHIPRATRVGNSIIQSDARVGKASKGQRLYEAIVELRKQ